MKKRIFKAAFAVILILPFALTMVSCGNTTAKVPDAESASGAIEGSSLTWSYDAVSKTLSISGTGDMPSFADSAKVSWFAARHSIEKIRVAEGITSIGDYAFYYTPKLTEVSIPASVKSIGKLSFAFCSSLKTLKLPSSLASVGDSCFEGCVALESIFVPASVTSIGEGAFAYCSALKSVFVMAHITELRANTFKNCKAIETLMFYTEVKGLENTDAAFVGASKTFANAEFLASDTGEATLKIVYQYEGGETAAEMYESKLSLGSTYSVNSPAIEGYTASVLTVSGTVTRDTDVTVTYTVAAAPETTPNEGTTDTQPAPEKQPEKPTVGTIIAIVVFVVVIAAIVVFAVFMMRSDKKAQNNASKKNTGNKK